MKRYVCHFDGAYKPSFACSAFFVESEGITIYSETNHERVISAYLSEMRALFMLLKYIKREIAPGSTVAIFGDAKFVIDRMTGKFKGSRTNETKRLFKALKKDYRLSISYIRRLYNSAAHDLAHTEYLPKPDFFKSVDDLHPREYLFTESKMMLLDDIIIRDSLKNSKPGDNKYNNKLSFYRQHGYVDKNIKVTSDGVLMDGYISYLILKENGTIKCKVDVFS